MSKKPTELKEDEVETTGHSWDGIEEFNNPLPRWWLYTLYATIVWAIGYTIAYPAWPMLTGATPGVLEWSTRGDVAAEIKAVDVANAEIESRLAAADLATITDDADLNRYANNAGKAVFQTWCIQCHQTGGQGAKGYPNLLDDDWLWGGDITAIHTTIAHGVRTEDDDDARFSEMPKFGADELLEPAEIDQVVQFVLQVSDQEADAAMATAGAVIFEDNCASCHADDAKGDRDQGAPNLTDAIWLYGGDEATIRDSVMNARFGVMPSWTTRLSQSDINAVAAYVHQLGGGE